MWRIGLLSFVIFSCGQISEKENARETLYKRLSAEETGIHFENVLKPSEDFDVFRYRNFYNGGGVAIGDINNDGLPDVFLTANMGPNRLFLNKGNFKFEDISKKAGVEGTKVWSTGVSMVDLNADGLLDIYVCNSGDPKGNSRENELFINNGNLTFSEKAAEYNLDDRGFSTHAVFFDYDKDGDLDSYVLNNSFRPISTLGFKNLRDKRDELGGDKLFRNDNGKFVNVSEESGIFGSVIGFGLGVTVGDINGDNWLDLYISNDFYERDYLYINNQDGTFSENLEERMGHLSMFSMGADIADINNDGYPDIFSTDMLPDDPSRLKRMSSFETYDVYQLRLKNGYYHQFMRNMLQLNNKNGTFSDVGELAGVAATDWSWGALISDFDNDSHKEIFVCNGIYKDVTDQDFVEYLGSSEQIKAAMDGKKIDFKEFVERMSSEKLSNHMFKLDGQLSYKDVAYKWGLDEPSFSNGAAYGDLDNDGDLDMIVNNVNQELFVYRNEADKIIGNNYLSLTFEGSEKNRFGIGSSVKVFANGQTLLYNHMPMRGFQSSMDYKLIIGLGKSPLIDSVVVTWPDDKTQVIKNVAINSVLKVKNSDAILMDRKVTPSESFFKETRNFTPVIHEENEFNDFDRDRLLYHMLSTQGPAFAKGDLNRDGLDDIFLGGSVGTGGKLFIQRERGFEEINSSVFLADKESEDIDAVFFDADQDSDLDLYVVSGGSEHLAQSPATLDRLYINKGLRNGWPVFEKSKDKIPLLYNSGSCVRPQDIDNDGDMDLFIGNRVIPSYYGLPVDQTLLLNDGKGNFSDATATMAPGLRKLGMVTDASWFDYDDNGFADLMIVGDWMPLTIFSNDGKTLSKVKDVPGLEESEGWWNTIKALDIDKDGDTDFVVGNVGMNSKFKPSPKNPIHLYIEDFDQNGSLEPIFTYTSDGKEYPFALRQDLIKQMSSLKKKFVFFKDYADKSVADIFDPAILRRARKLNFYQSQSVVLLNNGKSGFEVQPLPVEAQVSPVFAIESMDVNRDKTPDLILGGNLYSVKPEVGRYDAMHGLVLIGSGNGTFETLPAEKAGIFIDGQVREISKLKNKSGELLSFALNNDTLKFFILR